MPNYNHLTFMGNLTKDPELKDLGNDRKVCEFTVAESEYWTNKSGERKEDTCFLDCCCYGGKAEVLAQHLKKGSAIMLDGKISQDTWEKDGKKYSKHKMIIRDFTFIGKKESQVPDPENPGVAQDGGYNTQF